MTRVISASMSEWKALLARSSSDTRRALDSSRTCLGTAPGAPNSRLGAVLESTEETVQGHAAAFDVAFVGLRHLRSLRRRFLAVLEDSQRVAQLLDVAGQPVTPLLPSVSPSGRKSGEEELNRSA